jgi:hypothetical protein
MLKPEPQIVLQPSLFWLFFQHEIAVNECEAIGDVFLFGLVSVSA